MFIYRTKVREIEKKISQTVISINAGALRIATIKEQSEIAVISAKRYILLCNKYTSRRIYYQLYDGNIAIFAVV